VRSIELGLPAASGDRSEGVSVDFPTSFGEDGDCRIYVASLYGPVYRLADPAATVPDGCPQGSPPPGGSPGPGSSALTLDLTAKKQGLKKRLKLFATASSDSTLVAASRAIKRTTKRLAANQRTAVRVALKRAKRKRLRRTLDRKGRATVTVRATATDQGGATATDKVKVRLEG
jgi:hypothetical protein